MQWIPLLDIIDLFEGSQVLLKIVFHILCVEFSEFSL